LTSFAYKVGYTAKKGGGVERMNKKLKVLIFERFGSQAEFSMAIKEDESTISRVIRGRRKLNDDRMNKWAEALGCRPDEFLALIMSSTEEVLDKTESRRKCRKGGNDE